MPSSLFFVSFPSNSPLLKNQQPLQKLLTLEMAVTAQIFSFLEQRFDESHRLATTMTAKTAENLLETAPKPTANDLIVPIEPFLAVLDCLSDALGRSVPAIARWDELHDLPPGSLGRSLVAFLDQHQLQPFTTGPRRKQLHDSIHVLTGYGTDPIGEAELQAFLLGVHFNLANAALGFGLLAAIRYRRRRGLISESPVAVRQRLRAAYWRGVESCFNPNTWQPEQEWALPLEQVRWLYRL